jgi:hypothetical protein
VKAVVENFHRKLIKIFVAAKKRTIITGLRPFCQELRGGCRKKKTGYAAAEKYKQRLNPIYLICQN